MVKISTKENLIVSPKTLLIVIPSFDDYEALEKLLLIIDAIHIPQNIILEIMIVDDYSTQPISRLLNTQEFNQIKQVHILRLRRNLGHQRAITVGLCYVYQNLNCDFIVVMDGDGEDNPFEIENLLHTSEQKSNRYIIFAKRTKRSESNLFKLLYFIYQKLYFLLVGKEIKVGNFSLIPAYLLKNVVVISEIWNHYSSGLHRSRIPYFEVDIPRAKRLDGKPKMNLVSLITHGLSSIAVNGDIVGTRILLAIVVLLCLLLSIGFLVITIRLFSDFAIPGWATYMISFLIITVLQLILIGTVFSLIILASRNNVNIIPIRDYKHYIDTCIQLRQSTIEKLKFLENPNIQL